MGLSRVRVLLFCAAASDLFGQIRDLASLSLGDFMQVEVTSVSKVRQQLVRSPAAVFVITQDDIRRSGASSLPEVLRLSPGVHVARVGTGYWSVGIRGFSGVYSNKLLVLIDGRTVYSPLFSGVFWTQDLILLEDIERIEIVRGPGATMWGANAVSGVISIATRSARQTTGRLVSVSGGSLNPVRTAFRYGAALNEQVAWRTWGQYSRLDHPPFAPGVESTGSLNTGRAAMRMEWEPGARDAFEIEGEIRRNASRVSGIDLANPFGPRRHLESTDNSTYVRGSWRRVTPSGTELVLRMYANRNGLDSGTFTASATTADADVQVTFRPMGGHRLLAGGGARGNFVRTRGSAAFDFQPASRDYSIYNGFLQDEWELAPRRLALTLGAKVEQYRYAGHALEPTVRLMWTPTALQGYWVAVSRALRTPAHSDYALRLTGVLPGLAYPVQLAGNLELQPEALTAYEAGLRRLVTRRLALDVTGFRHRFRRLNGYVLASDLPTLPRLPTPVGTIPVIPLVARNLSDGVNQGVEASAQFDLGRGLQLSGSYSSVFARIWLRPGYKPQYSFELPVNMPEHQGQVRAAWSFARNWSADAAVYRFGAMGGGALPGRTRVDGRIARRLGESMEISVSGQNLLRPNQTEVLGDVVFPRVSVPRSVEATVRWTF